MWQKPPLVRPTSQLVAKASFIDSYMLVKTMLSYMEVAPQTEISYTVFKEGTVNGIRAKY